MSKSQSSGRFLRHFLANPGRTGAIAPSSQGLAGRMVEWIDWDNVETVIEYGPGTGVFTEHILARMNPQSRFFGIELNPEFHASLLQRFPDVTFHLDSVENVEVLCREHGVESVDAILCGLPWASFPEELQKSCMDAMMRMLRPGGRFVTFAYLQGLALPAGQRFKNMLHARFGHVEKSPTVWMNLPPAFVYRCTV